MTDFWNIKRGDFITTSDGLICIFDYLLPNGHFMSQVTNNIGDNICLHSSHRLISYNPSTDQQKEKLRTLCKKNGIEIVPLNNGVNYYE